MAPPTSPPPSRAPLWIALLLTLVRLWLVGAQDLMIVGGAGHDDRLFADLASRLLAGEWLGPYHERTLIKGPFYPMFLAAARILGVPLLLAQHLLYTAACWLFVRALGPWVGRRWLALVLYAVLLLNPMSFSDGPMTRVVREGVYPALTLLVLACACALVLRAEGPPRRLAGWSVGLGLALGAFWLTREEGIWLLPSVTLLAAAAAWRIPRRSGRHRAARMLLCLLPFLLAAAAVGTVALLNRAHYGEAVVVEIQGRPFRAAYGALARAGAESFELYVPVPEPVRRRLYEVSPAFAELEPYLDGPMGQRWAFTSHRQTWKLVEDDIAGGWFLWALREAATAAGHHGSAPEAAEYYRRLAAEVDAACETGELPCAAPRASLAPVWRSRYVKPLMVALVTGAVYLARLTHFGVEARSSLGTREDLDSFRELTGERLTALEEGPVRRSGWAFAPGSELRLVVRRSGGVQVEAGVRFRASPAAYEHFRALGRALPETRRARFNLWAPRCLGCSLEARSGGRLLASVPLDGRGVEIDRPDLYLNLWPLEEGSLEELTAVPLRSFRLRTLTAIAGPYGWLTPALALLALLAWLAGAGAVLREWRLPAEWLLVTALLGAVAARLLFICLVHVTSYPAIRHSYLAPAYPLLYAFVLLTLWQGGRRAVEELGRWLR